MGYYFTVLQIYILVYFTTAGQTMSLYNENCRYDEDCTETNTYCYDSGKCVKCTDCSTYNRQQNPKGMCAKNKNHCGPCFPGMESDTNTDGSYSICRPILTTIISTNSNTESSNNHLIPVNNNYPNLKNWIFYPAILILLLLFIFLFYKTKIYTRFTTVISRTSMNNCSPPPPPPYSEKNPTAPPYEEHGGGPTENPPIQRVIRSIENEPSQRANPFVNPYNIRGGTLNRNSPDPNPVNDEDNDNENENATLLNQPVSNPYDEETQPSSWTPSDNNSTEPSLQLQTFSEALSNLNNLTQLNISQPDDNHLENSEEEPNTDNTGNTGNQNFTNSSSTSAQQVNILICNVNLNST